MSLNEQKQTEEQLRPSEQFARSILNSSIEGIIITDSDQLILHFNPPAEKMFGYSAIQVLGKSLDILIPSTSRGALKKDVQDFPKSNVSHRAIHGALDVMALHANGKEFPVEVSISQFEVNGKKAFAASVRDITMRKQAEDHVRFQAHILKSIDQAVIVTTPAGIVTYVNQFAETLYGWTATDAIEKSIMELTVPQTSSAQAQEIMASLREGRNWQGEFVAQRKDGSVIMVQVVNTPIMDENGNISAIAGISSDITTHKAVEVALRESEARLLVAQAVAKVGSWETDLSTLEVIWSNQTYEIFDLDPKTFHSSHQAFLEFVHPQDRAIVDDAFKTSFNNDVYNTIEHRIITAKGVTKYVEERWKIFRDDQKQPLRAVGICQDITERKEAEEKYKRNNQLLEASQAIAKVGGWELDLTNNHLFWTAETYRIHDTSPEEFNPTVDAGVGYFLPESKRQISEALELAVTKGVGYDLYLETYTTKGRKINVRTTCEVTLVNGKPIKLTGIFQDITEQKQAELELHTMGQRNHLATLVSGVGIWEWNINNNRVKWDKQMFNLYGMVPTEDDFLDFSQISALVLQEELPEQESILQETIKLRGSSVREFHIRRVNDGQVRLIKAVDTVHTNKEGNVEYLLGTNVDITELKQAELELQATKQKLESIFGEMEDVVWSMSYPALETLFVTPSVEQLYGYPIQEWMAKGSTLYQRVIHPEDRELISQMFERLEKNHKVEQSYRVITAGRITKWVNSKIRVIKDQNGSPIRLDGQVEDITDRKQSEFALQESEKKFRGLFENLIDEVHLWKIIKNKSGKISGWQLVDVNPSALKSWDKSINDVIGKTANEIFGADAHDQFMPIVEEIFKTHKPYHWENYFAPTDQYLYMESIPFGDYFISTGKDITEQKKIQNEKETSNARLSIAKEAAQIGIWEFFLEDQKLIWDDKMFDLFNVSKSTFSGTYEAWRSIVHPDDLERSEQELQNAITSGQSFNSEFRIIWQDKSIHHIKGMAESVRDTNGKPYKMIGVNYDITEQKEAQNEIERSNARLSIATQSAHIGIWEFIIEEDILIWEDETLKLFGLTRESFSGNYEGWKSTVHPDDVDEAEQKIREAIANKTILNMEFRTIWPDRTIRYIGAFGKTILDNSGKVIKLVGTNYDVTDRVQKEIELIQAKEKAEKSENNLKASERRLLAIIDTEPECVKLVAPNGKLLEMNTVGLNMLEASSVEEINQIGLMSFILPSHQDEFRQFHESVIRGESGMLQFEVAGLKGTKRWLESHAKPLILENDSVPVLLAVTRDVTMRVQMEQELKKQNEELIEAKEKAEESDRLKTAFLANMSHEIRTPMNGILGFANLLQKQDITPQKEKEYLALIQQSGTRMLNIINDIISISKIESGEISITLSSTNINEKLEFIKSFFEPEASAKGIQIVVTSLLPAQNAVIITDKEKVYGTLTNLVKNAIKFTSAGTIELGSREKPEQAELEFFVKDMGIGIPHDQLDFIFERFRQVNESTTRDYEGAGLGLAISKAQVEKLGGKMWVESEVGKGSSFYFTIPCQRDVPGTQLQAAEPGSSKNREQSHKGIKIVLAEDDFISATFLKAVLNINGNEILHATTGTEVVEIMRNNPDTDVVLMDLSMPELNGYEATSQIRQFNKTAVIIVQSGYTFEENIKQALEAGCTDYIAKPVDENVLLRMIEKHVRK